uniref:DNA replication complex GINS protein PSF3 n=1 Tax=Strigamia maritima TaxID=126957 RepID=T1JJC2_STRMM
MSQHSSPLAVTPISLSITRPPYGILTTHQRIQCTFKKTVHKLGYLNPAADDENLEVGTKLELPFWLAQDLSKRAIVRVDIPKVYKESYREILQADATVVDLHKIGPNFYNFATHVIIFEHAESKQIMECLMQTFKERFKRIMDASQNHLQNGTNDIIGKLDDFEKYLFKRGQESFKDYQQWQNRKIEKITTSEGIVNHKKRKRKDS